jgi:hypothetical protein
LITDLEIFKTKYNNEIIHCKGWSKKFHDLEQSKKISEAEYCIFINRGKTIGEAYKGLTTTGRVMFPWSSPICEELNGVSICFGFKKGFDETNLRNPELFK